MYINHELLYSKALECANQFATAPYSNILVGAAALLSNGEIIVGANHENSSSPVGICAERSMLCSLQNSNKSVKILAISIAALKDGKIINISPCGMCRQAIFEQESMQNSPINISFLYNNKMIIISSISELLPYAFSL